MLFGFPWWMLLFFAIGVYAAVTKLLQLFFSFGMQLGYPSANTVPPTDSRAFLDGLSLSLDSPIRRGGSARILNNGNAFFPALLQAIRGAQHSIHLMTYIWQKGSVSDTLLEALLERARSGVEVRIMIDGIGSFFAPDESFKALREAGGQVAVFAPLLSSHFLHPNRRNHRRAFVIDGDVAFTGGMSVADQWTGDAEDPEHWRDTMVQVTGSMAQAVQGVFMQLWANIEGDVLVGPAYLPPQEEQELQEDVSYLSVPHSPTPLIQPLQQFFWFSFQAARESIYVANSYFAPGRSIRHVLMQKARAGLDVRLLLPSAHTDNAFVRWAAHYLYDSFLASGIRIYEYQPTMMHAKHLVIDGRWTVIGSANIDVRSFKLNQENVLGIQDEALGREMGVLFEKDLERAHEITREEWRRRPWWYRVREYAALPFQAQY